MEDVTPGRWRMRRRVNRVHVYTAAHVYTAVQMSLTPGSTPLNIKPVTRTPHESRTEESERPNKARLQWINTVCMSMQTVCSTLQCLGASVTIRGESVVDATALPGRYLKQLKVLVIIIQGSIMGALPNRLFILDWRNSFVGHVISTAEN